MPLTENQVEVVRNLYGESPNGITPMCFGGSNGSHHSNTATALCKGDHPLVERTRRGLAFGEKPRYRDARGSYKYRLTLAGIQAAEAMGCKVSVVIGGSMSETRAAFVDYRDALVKAAAREPAEASGT